MHSEAGNSRTRVFAVCFAAIVATSFCFVLRALVVDQWGVEFGLSETQKGELLGAGLWPFAITIVLLSLVIDRIGFKTALWIAAACHAAGLAIIYVADGYWSLYAGTFIMALGNGAVEAAANPLIATVYNDDKPRWLNRLHAGWPGGLVLGGLLAIGLGDMVGWRIKIILMAAPVAIYATMLIGQRFPRSESAVAGVPYREMLREAGYVTALIITTLMMVEIGRVVGLPGVATFAFIGILTGAYAFYARSAGRPLYILLVVLMIPLATTELSTDSWISSLMEPEMRAVGLQAGWVLVYTSAIMFVVRLFAGSVIHRFSALGTLAGGSALAACGLFLLSGSTGLALLIAATLYGAGKSFFWGTSLAVASEQFPRGGAVTINVMAGSGMLSAGIVGSMLLGALQDSATQRQLAAHDVAYGTQLTRTYLVGRHEGMLGSYAALDAGTVARAPAGDKAVLASIEGTSKKSALRSVALLPVLMLAVYLGLIAFFRRRGGYRPVQLESAANPAT